MQWESVPFNVNRISLEKLPVNLEICYIFPKIVGDYSEISGSIICMCVCSCVWVIECVLGVSGVRVDGCRCAGG